MDDAPEITVRILALVGKVMVQVKRLSSSSTSSNLGLLVVKASDTGSDWQLQRDTKVRERSSVFSRRGPTDSLALQERDGKVRRDLSVGRILDQVVGLGSILVAVVGLLIGCLDLVEQVRDALVELGDADELALLREVACDAVKGSAIAIETGQSTVTHPPRRRGCSDCRRRELGVSTGRRRCEFCGMEKSQRRFERRVGREGRPTRRGRSERQSCKAAAEARVSLSMRRYETARSTHLNMETFLHDGSSDQQVRVAFAESREHRSLLAPRHPRSTALVREVSS
jgi:hypothetical protein